MTGTQKIIPHLWYVSEAEEAARVYARRGLDDGAGGQLVLSRSGPIHVSREEG